MGSADQMDRVVNLAKRRGFVFPSSEIYGGFRSTWDYGPLGVLLKRNVMEAWWRAMVQLRDDVVGLGAAILMAPQVWEASGHLGAGFADLMVDCRNCQERFRDDHLPEVERVPELRHRRTPSPKRQFNLMFKTFVGPVEDDASVAYLRPETAQGIFVNFKNVQTTTRKRPPFGIAQICKSLRNEITPGNFIFRTREFEQMEMEYFDAARRRRALVRVLVSGAVPLVRRPRHRRGQAAAPPARSRRALALFGRHVRRRVRLPLGLGASSRASPTVPITTSRSTRSTRVRTSPSTTRRPTPATCRHVIEPALGADQATLAFLLAAYEEEEVPNGKGGTETRTVLHLHPRLAPITVAVLPLSKNERLVPVADEVASLLRPHFMIDVDVTGSIGRRYRRQDEVGTPLCVTVDFDTLDDQAVTIRDRDTMQQARVPIAALRAELDDRLDR